MRAGFIVTSPYQFFHFEKIQRHLAAAIVYVEVREQEFGVTEDLVRKHLPSTDIVWVNSRDLRKIDGECDVLVCQTPAALMHFFSKSLVVAQQYSLAKEHYQYGVWRAQANLNLMYGKYSSSCVSGFSNAVPVGNPLLDTALADGRALALPQPVVDPLRVLYMPTYGDLSDKGATVRQLVAQGASLSIKPHHADEGALHLASQYDLPVVGSDEDPIASILDHDVVVSDYSGAIYDALAVRRPVVLTSSLNEISRDAHRLSGRDRSRADIADLTSIWTGDVPFWDVYEQSRVKLTDGVLFQEFLDRYFVNLGNAGEACAREIIRLVDAGEPEAFSVRQVREANRRYIVENRDLKAQLSAISSSNRFQLASLKQTPPRTVVLKAMRWGLTKLPGGERVLEGLRKVRQAGRAGHSAHDRVEDRDPWGLPAVPRLRRRAMLNVVEKSLRSRGIDCRTRSTQSGVYCAVRQTELEAVCAALNELGSQCAPSQLHVWLGRGSAYDIVRFAESLTLGDLAESDSMVVGIPCQNQLYGLGREGGVEILIVEPRDARLVALRWRAEKVDWTREFSESKAASIDEIGTHALEKVPIDVVYTWVDSSDPEWQAARREWADKQHIELESAGNDERYIDREELRYSLRSLWLYAPFIRNVFLVTADHRPEWLDASQENIHVVSHKEIFPDASDLPTFNSHAIEACLHHIPGLSEHFIYFNDDVFLGRETTVQDYFTKAGLMKSRLSPSSFTAMAEPDVRAIPTDWASYNAVHLIDRAFGLHFDRKMKHVPMPLKRSVLEEIDHQYAELVSRTRAARFRSRTDLSLPSMLAHYYGIATRKAVEWDGRAREYAYADTGRFDFPTRLEAIIRHEPTFVCLNITRHSDIGFDEQAVLLQKYLKERYPIPSPFEIALGK